MSPVRPERIFKITGIAANEGYAIHIGARHSGVKITTEGKSGRVVGAHVDAFSIKHIVVITLKTVAIVFKDIDPRHVQGHDDGPRVSGAKMESINAHDRPVYLSLERPHGRLPKIFRRESRGLPATMGGFQVPFDESKGKRDSGCDINLQHCIGGMARDLPSSRLGVRNEKRDILRTRSEVVDVDHIRVLQRFHDTAVRPLDGDVAVDAAVLAPIRREESNKINATVRHNLSRGRVHSFVPPAGEIDLILVLFGGSIVFLKDDVNDHCCHR